MKRLFFLFVLALLNLSLNAQTLLKGVLVDSLTREAEPYSTVRVFKDDNTEKPVAMSVTDAEGRIRQRVAAKGKFIIIFSSLGKALVERSLTLSGEPEVDLGTVFVHDDAQSLGEVTVKAQAPLVRMETDKMSYNVQDDVDSKSSTVLDMLRKVPMVTVDGQDNITVNGSSSFKVYVDGKPNPMMSANPSQVFKVMPASMVKTIEVVTNPGAKYDAEGAVGVLNLTMNREQAGGAQEADGYNGSVALAAGNRSYGAQGYVSAQKGRFSVSGNMAFQHQLIGGIEVTIDNSQTAGNGTSLTHAVSETDQHSNAALGNLSLSYDLGSMSVVSVAAGLMHYRQKQHTPLLTSLQGGYYGGGVSYQNEEWERPEYQNLSLSADYQRFFNKERTRSLTLSYLFALNPIHRDATDYYELLSGMSFVDLTNRMSFNHMLSREHTLQLDYTTPLSKTLSLSAGVKYVGRRNTSNSEYYTAAAAEFTYRGDLSMRYKYLNHIAAAYAEATANLGKLGAKAGLRYEYTWQHVTYELGNGEDFRKHYGNLVPSMSLTYNMAPTRNIGLTYNMRISRPGITYLNPYVERSPLSQTYGNTMLEVEKNHNVGLVFNSFSRKLMVNASLRQSFCDDAISQYQFYEGSILNATFGNIVRQRVSSLSTYLNWAAARETRLIFNGGVSYSDFHSDMLAQKANGWVGNLMLGLQQTLPWKVKMSANLMASTKSYSLQGWSSGFSGVFGSFSKDLCKDRLNIALQYFTGFHRHGRLAFDNYHEGRDFTAMQHIRVPVAQFMVKVSYSFGNLKKQFAQRKSKIESDFIDRKESGTQLPGGMGM